MKRVTIGFSKARSRYAILSKLIMLVQNTPFSHTYVRFSWPAADTDLIYQASKTRINFESLPSFVTHSEIVKEFDMQLSDDTWSNIAKYIIKHLNKRYSFMQLIGMGIMQIFKKLNKNINNPYGNGHDGFICAEIVSDILYQAGRAVSVPSEDADLKEIYEFLERSL